MWATNVGNEIGQVLISVITTGEGHALIPMAEGLMARYSSAGVPAPEALYVDRDCCGSTPVRKLFHLWKDVPIRLDIWHFMRRIAGGVTSENHMLYAGFMNQLSRCLFEWDNDDLLALKEAKLHELQARDIFPHDTNILGHISKRELALHCRRRTRGADETATLIKKLLDCYKGAVDTMGVPLLKADAMATIWEKQQHHVSCIQDPPGVQLYIQTGSMRKGNRLLPTYRFFYFLFFFPYFSGTLANEVLFQAYIVEGLARWNQNWASAAQGVSREEPVSYSQSLREATNQLSEAVIGKKILPSFRSPRIYTGML
ncbi:hypothetical protein HOLleu_11725 [Holothuria leucospilota]|uniref:Uncharacterized protein n=1 Tax=Holothuria leucospilota TaxID=206669 RepID=A0A9Q1HFS3_HOLLE|nr:hypothetical protein HOLleu_11725 [Holothuria leucospilota]